VADDAVLIAPVSKPKFPANREINREFFNFGPNSAILMSIRYAIPMAYGKIPYVTEQGIICAEQGIFGSEQGISATDQGKRRS
jgi:hypothetical protein